MHRLGSLLVSVGLSFVLAAAIVVGGHARVWRAPLVFDRDSVPRSAANDAAELGLWFTGWWITASGTRSAGDGLDVSEAASLLGEFLERAREMRDPQLFLPALTVAAQTERAKGNRAAAVDLVRSWPPVASWPDGDEDDGWAVRQRDAQEIRRRSGPRFASTRAADAAARPRIVVTDKGGGASG